MSEVSKRFTPDEFEAIYKVEEHEDNMRLDQYCAIFLESFSREQIKKKIKMGEVQILGRPHPHKPSVKVYHNEKVRFFTPRGTLEDEYWRGAKLELELDPPIIFENENLLVISKPPYMTTHPTGKHLFNSATVYFEDKLGHTVHSVHRLDRETSGVQLLAKNPKSAQTFSGYFEDDFVSKCYFLIAHKNKKCSFPLMACDRMGSEDDFIPRLFVHCYPENSHKGKEAQTEFELIHEDQKYYLLLAFPKTGRQHQIRAHASHHGFPLLGDKLYNGDVEVFRRFKDEKATEADFDLMQISRHALHAMALKMKKGELQDIFIAPMPKDLQNWIDDHMAVKDLEQKIKTLIERKFNAKI